MRRCRDKGRQYMFALDHAFPETKPVSNRAALFPRYLASSMLNRHIQFCKPPPVTIAREMVGLPNQSLYMFPTLIAQDW